MEMQHGAVVKHQYRSRCLGEEFGLFRICGFFRATQNDGYVERMRLCNPRCVRHCSPPNPLKLLACTFRPPTKLPRRGRLHAPSGRKSSCLSSRAKPSIAIERKYRFPPELLGDIPSAGLLACLDGAGGFKFGLESAFGRG